jgi:hypothetical protein
MLIAFARERFFALFPRAYTPVGQRFRISYAAQLTRNNAILHRDHLCFLLFPKV